MTPIEPKIHQKQDLITILLSHVEMSQIKNVHAIHTSSAVPKIHIDCSIWILASSCDCANVEMSNGKYIEC